MLRPAAQLGHSTFSVCFVHSILCGLPRRGPSSLSLRADKAQGTDFVNSVTIRQILIEWQLCARHYERETWASIALRIKFKFLRKKKIEIFNDLNSAYLANAVLLWVLEHKFSGQVGPQSRPRFFPFLWLLVFQVYVSLPWRCFPWCSAYFPLSPQVYYLPNPHYGLQLQDYLFTCLYSMSSQAVNSKREEIICRI